MDTKPEYKPVFGTINKVIGMLLIIIILAVVGIYSYSFIRDVMASGSANTKEAESDLPSTPKSGQDGYTASNFSPKQFDAQSCDPEQNQDGGCSWDIGTWAKDSQYGGVGTAQVAIIAGVDISWPQGGDSFSADPDNRCELVVMDQGLWLHNANLKDARMVVYTISTADYEGWTNVLAVQEMATQAQGYKCPVKDTVTFWKNVNGNPQASTLKLKDLPDIKIKELQTGSKSDSSSEISGSDRQATGQGQELKFAAGHTVAGSQIVLSNGTTYKECVLKNASVGGTVNTGVINPWEDEIKTLSECK